MNAFRKARCWVDSVQGLVAHVRIYRAMLKAGEGREPTPAYTAQLRQQEGMVGHAFLHVALVFPLGSGAFI